MKLPNQNDAENARLNSAKQDFEMIASKLIFELIRQKKLLEIQKKHLNLKKVFSSCS